MKICNENDGFTVQDMMFFGYGHIDGAIKLLNEGSRYLYSAGYLAHLGTEVLLKAWHLNVFDAFENTHKLTEMYYKLKNHDSQINIGATNEAFLIRLDEFYFCRYVARKDVPIEVGSYMLDRLEKLMNSFWKIFPDKMLTTYDGLKYPALNRSIESAYESGATGTG